MRLSAHFTLSELTTTSQQLPNVPGPQQITELRELAAQVLEPWRAVIGPIRITSGYRSAAVNVAVGGSRTSDHVHGRAADCAPLAVSLDVAWRALVALAEDLPLDQAILYVRRPGQGWIHVGRRVTPRRELLVQRVGLPTAAWAGYSGPLVAR